MAASDIAYPKRKERNLLFIAFCLGILALLCNLRAIYVYRQLSCCDFTVKGWDNFGRLWYDAVGMLLLEGSEVTTPGIWVVLGRIFTVLFAGFGILGIIFELSQRASDTLLWLRLSIQEVRGKKPVFIIGLGYIGGKIADDCLAEGRPVYGVCLDRTGFRPRRLRKKGVLTYQDDMTDGINPRIRKRIIKRRPFKNRVVDIFIATGNDRQNLKIARDIRLLLKAAGNTEANCYVHIAATGLRQVIEEQKMLEDIKVKKKVLVSFYAWSTSDLIAYDLCSKLFLRRNLGLMPPRHDESPLKWGEQFHVFLIGFGEKAQAVASAIARLAHFKDQYPPLITVLGKKEDSVNWKNFLDTYPGFTYPTNKWDNKGNSWNWGDDEWGIVKYATWAEFKEADSIHQKLKCIKKRRAATKKACLVYCTENEEQNLEGALRLKTSLVKEAGIEDIPLFVCLPGEDNFSNLLESDSQKEDKQFTLYSFGSRGHTLSYDVITRSKLQGQADAIKKAYEALSGNDGSGHVNFELSNYEAVLHAEVKMDALGIFFTDKEDTGLGKPLLKKYFTKRIEKEIDQLSGKWEEGMYKLRLIEFERLDKLVKQRLALLNMVKITDREIDSAKKLLKAEAEKVVKSFQEEVEGKKITDIPAIMEHNRWMGERLMQGWTYDEEKNEELKKRPSLKEWGRLKGKERLYDRQQIPTIIFSQRLRKEGGRQYAYINKIVKTETDD